MSQDLMDLVVKYKRQGILIDTSLAVLYVVGSFDPLLVGRHKRTGMFTQDDFERLSAFVDKFDRKVVTPKVLTEVGNHLGRRPELRAVFAGFVERSNEEFLESRRITHSPAFSIFGLTDAGILEVAKGKFLVLTDDGPLSDYLGRSNTDVVSFAQIRKI